MASAKKRKLASTDWRDTDEESDIDSFATEINQTAIKRRRVPQKKKNGFRIQSENLIAKLPGKLRNRIYELVLVNNDSHHDSLCVRTYHAKRRWDKGPHRRTPKFRQPALLLVSKMIRQEASSIYFGSNRFQIFLTLSTIERGMAWVAQHLAFLHEEKDLKVSIHVKCLNLQSIPDWFPLARFVFTQPRGSFAEAVCIERYCRLFSVSGFSKRVAGCFRKMITLCVQARYGGFTHRQFAKDYKNWAWTAMKRDRGVRLSDRSDTMKFIRSKMTTLENAPQASY